jgi:ABC-type microcin C transport system permease subunit YejE
MQIDQDWMLIGIGIAVVVGIILAVYIPPPLGYLVGTVTGIFTGFIIMVIGTKIERIEG